jgi:hypothetical protein
MYRTPSRASVSQGLERVRGCKEKKEGTVHGTVAPCDNRSAQGRLFLAQAGGALGIGGVAPIDHHGRIDEERRARASRAQEPLSKAHESGCTRSGAGSSGASFRPSDTRGDGAPVWCAQRLPNAAAWSRANSAMPRASIPVRSFTAEVTWDSQPREYAVK